MSSTNNNSPSPNSFFDKLLDNFPLGKDRIRDIQRKVLQDIANAYAQGYKKIVVELPPGGGKSAIAVAVAKTIGTSYFITATKDLQQQYVNDFPYIKAAKGMNSFTCHVNDKSVDKAPCRYNSNFQNGGCKYKTQIRNYTTVNANTPEELVMIESSALENYEHEFDKWDIPRGAKKYDHFIPCTYYHSLYSALKSTHTILNYANFILFQHIPLYSMPRGILILDEGHLLVNEVVGYHGLEISVWTYSKYIADFEIEEPKNNPDDIASWIPFLEQVRDQLDESLEKQQSSEDSSNSTIRQLSEEQIIKMKEHYEKLDSTIERIEEDIDNWIMATNLVKEKKKTGDKLTKVSFKPIDLAPFCKPLLDKGTHLLILSSTILDKNEYCKSVGLEPNEVMFLQYDSDFPVENRRIVAFNTVYPSFRNINDPSTRARLSKAVNTIISLDKHKNDKGLIHTTSYPWSSVVKEYLSKENLHRIIETKQDNSTQRIKVIEEHCILRKNEPTILLSPSLHTGLDLPGDLSRFQIQTKIPWPDSSDKWVEANKKRNPEWYKWQTALRLIQSYGRSIRSKEDYAITYVLDGTYKNFVNKNESLLPKWYRDAIVWEY